MQPPLPVNDAFSLGGFLECNCHNQHKHLINAEGVPHDRTSEQFRHECNNQRIHHKTAHNIQGNCLTGALGGKGCGNEYCRYGAGHSL